MTIEEMNSTVLATPEDEFVNFENLHFCDMTICVRESNPYHPLNFSGASFTNCTFLDLFAESMFLNCNFDACTFSADFLDCHFSGSQFHDCTFNNRAEEGGENFFFSNCLFAHTAFFNCKGGELLFDALNLTATAEGLDTLLQAAAPSGDIIGWTCLNDGTILQLLIPSQSDRIRVNGGNKYLCSYAKVKDKAYDGGKYEGLAIVGGPSAPQKVPFFLTVDGAMQMRKELSEG